MSNARSTNGYERTIEEHRNWLSTLDQEERDRLQDFWDNMEVSTMEDALVFFGEIENHLQRIKEI